MLAVANVVLNRVKSDAYWHVNTVEQAIYDRKWSVQFGVTVKNSKTGTSMMDKALKLYDTRKFTGANPEAQKKALNKAIKAAKAALSGKNNIGNYLCFQNKYSAKSIKKRYSDYRIIDDHIFYRTK
jgi:spore germination cell wall hydrolase CwlJ-like protein